MNITIFSMPKLANNPCRFACQIILLMSLPSGADAAGITNQQAVANAITSCNSLNSGDGVYFGPTNSICNVQATAANIQSLTPDQIFGMGYQSTRVNGGKVGQPYDYFRTQNSRMTGGGAGDDNFSRLSFWAKTDNDFGLTNTTLNSTGYRFDNHHFVFGADYRLQNNWVAGGSFTYQYNNATFDSGRGATTSNNYSGSIYTTYSITDALHVEATASYGGFNYQTSRNIQLSGFGSSVATGSPIGYQYAFSWGGGYDFTYQALTVAPYIRGDYMYQGINSYTETGSIAAMSFDSQVIESMVSTVGVQSSYTFSMPWGVLIPQLRGEWHHQYMDSQRQMQGSFTSDPTGQVITMTGNTPSSDYYTFGAEVSSVLPGGISAFLAYETLQGYTNVTSNKLMLGGRLEF